uniref:PDZ domain-containing protein n=1 Tax=Plectus sambesii TaxID=2011161 RepID=A0A914VQG9_9BILA
MTAEPLRLDTNHHTHHASIETKTWTRSSPSSEDHLRPLSNSSPTSSDDSGFLSTNDVLGHGLPASSPQQLDLNMSRGYVSIFAAQEDRSPIFVTLDRKISQSGGLLKRLQLPTDVDGEEKPRPKSPVVAPVIPPVQRAASPRLLSPRPLSPRPHSPAFKSTDTPVNRSPLPSPTNYDRPAPFAVEKEVTISDHRLSTSYRPNYASSHTSSNMVDHGAAEASAKTHQNHASAKENHEDSTDGHLLFPHIESPKAPMATTYDALITYETTKTAEPEVFTFPSSTSKVDRESSTHGSGKSESAKPEILPQTAEILSLSRRNWLNEKSDEHKPTNQTFKTKYEKFENRSVWEEQHGSSGPKSAPAGRTTADLKPVASRKQEYESSAKNATSVSPTGKTPIYYGKNNSSTSVRDRIQKYAGLSATNTFDKDPTPPPHSAPPTVGPPTWTSSFSKKPSAVTKSPSPYEYQSTRQTASSDYHSSRTPPTTPPATPVDAPAPFKVEHKPEPSSPPLPSLKHDSPAPVATTPPATAHSTASGLDFSRFGPVTPIGRPLESDEEKEPSNHDETDHHHQQTTTHAHNKLPVSQIDDATMAECRAMLGASADDYEIFEAVLERPEGVADGSVGIILTGSSEPGADSQITVSRVITGSVADSQISRRDRVLMVQGQKTNTMTPGEARQLLKAPAPAIHVVVARKRFDDHDDDSPRRSIHADMEIVPESAFDATKCKYADHPIDIVLHKGLLGVGLSLEGGHQSPMGDRPLTIKRIFASGAAAKNGQIKLGDQLVAMNGRDVTSMTHLEAWKMLKGLPEGDVTLAIISQQDVEGRRPLTPLVSTQTAPSAPTADNWVLARCVVSRLLLRQLTADQFGPAGHPPLVGVVLRYYLMVGA